MKRPSALPPVSRRAPDETAEPDIAEEPERAPADLLSFIRGRRERVSEYSDAEAEGEPAVEDATEHVGWLAVWRAARARRRSLRSEVRRFTARSRRRRLIAIVTASLVVLLIAASFGAAYSPLFSVERIEVVGAEQLDPATLQEALSDQLGRPLPTVDRNEVKSALVAFPLIETYTLEAHPPHDLVLRITERTAVGFIRSDAGFTSVDAAGVALATAPSAPAGLPEISVAAGPQSDTFAAVGMVLRSLPSSLSAQVITATADSPENVAFALDSGVVVIWGSPDDASDKVATLTAAMAALTPGTVSTFDVSAPSHLVVR